MVVGNRQLRGLINASTVLGAGRLEGGDDALHARGSVAPRRRHLNGEQVGTYDDDGCGANNGDCRTADTLGVVVGALRHESISHGVDAY